LACGISRLKRPGQGEARRDGCVFYLDLQCRLPYIGAITGSGPVLPPDAAREHMPENRAGLFQADNKSAACPASRCRWCRCGRQPFGCRALVFWITS